jgi:hypothetical protein
MISMLPIALILLTALLAILAAALVRLGAHGSSLPVTAEWIDELSVDHYRPMVRVLDSADVEFLRTQPGHVHRKETDLRVRRCRIFRDYLRSLCQDFQRMGMALELLHSQSDHEHSGILAILFQRRMAFAWALALVHLQLCLYGWGIGSVDAKPLIRAFESSLAELRHLHPAPMTACA